jgi:glutaredoxin 3
MEEIIVYSTPTCPWCRMLKDFLDERKVSYTNIDVSTDHVAAQKMIDKSGQMGVPQMEINGRMIVGFDKEEIEKELADLAKEKKN